MRTIDNGFADEPFKSQILYCFNCVLCKDERHQSFWHSLLKNINSKFSAALSENELEIDPKTFVQKHVDTAFLFRKLLSICSVRLTPQAEKQLLENPSTFLFVDSDIEEIQGKNERKKRERERERERECVCIYICYLFIYLFIFVCLKNQTSSNESFEHCFVFRSKGTIIQFIQ